MGRKTLMNNLPKDPVMLLSVVNTNLRDYYETLEELCEAKEIDEAELVNKLEQIDYRYDRERNQFV